MATPILKIDADNPDQQILEEATSLLLKGKIIVCPTDTCYTFAVNALDVESIEKVFSLKKRSLLNPIHVAVNSIEEAEKYAYINETARILAKKFLPGPLTLVLPKKNITPSILVGGRDTIGIRVPNNQTILNLTAMTNLPLTATSANVSGGTEPYTIQEVAQQLQMSIQNVALILDQGPLTPMGISTVVDLTTASPQILRKGQIGKEEVLCCLD